MDGDDKILRFLNFVDELQKRVEARGVEIHSSRVTHEDTDFTITLGPLNKQPKSAGYMGAVGGIGLGANGHKDLKSNGATGATGRKVNKGLSGRFGYYNYYAGRYDYYYE